MKCSGVGGKSFKKKKKKLFNICEKVVVHLGLHGERESESSSKKNQNRFF